MNPNLSLTLLVTLAPVQTSLSVACSPSSLEHSTNAAKNGSIRRKLSEAPPDAFFPVGVTWKVLLFEVRGIVGGGNGSRFMEYSFLEWFCSFLGIPGKCSQENGTPENRKGVPGRRGESSGKYEDPSEDDEDEEEKEGNLADDCWCPI
ncbi:hypothetical protein V6N13_075336 [Hibiscus sabdariffa]|uniref:Secreted protein n=1 Tax=Hibiscus sabdariffa TaxID=183260 RepID=A0ABR2UBF9_9ROSI